MALAIRVLQHVVPAYLLAAKEVPQSQASAKHYLIINGLTWLFSVFWKVPSCALFGIYGRGGAGGN